MIALAGVGGTAGAQVLYVDDDASLAGDGSNWATAYRFLQDALTDASGGDVSEIRVAQGVYLPDRDEANPMGISDCCVANGGLGCDDPTCEAAVCAVLPLCCVVNWDTDCAALAADLCPSECVDVRMATFQLINGVILRGGYSGPGEPDPDARDVDLYETTLSGDLIGDDGSDFLNNGENSYTVVTGSGTNSTAELDGFTITAGNANGPANGDPAWVVGGGMWNTGGAATISDCLFDANAAIVAGGGVYNFTGGPTFTNCRFTNNTAGIIGGGMRNLDGSNPILSDCVFVGNVAIAGGGAMHNESNCTPTLLNCQFLDNTATNGPGGGVINSAASDATMIGCTFSGNASLQSNGGGLLNFQSSPEIIDCDFLNNSAVGLGAAVYNNESSPQLTNCTFINNDTDSNGGGIANYFGSAPDISNCLFQDNSAVNGGGIRNESSDATIVDCIFSGNAASHFGGAIANALSSPTVIRCTFDANTAEDGGGGLVNATSSPTVTNCNFDGNTARFAGGVYNVLGSSPMITNCRFVGNMATAGEGGGMINDMSDPILVNCTFRLNNSGAFAGGAMANGASNPTVSNSILWNNSPNEILDVMGSATMVSYSNVQGGWSGTGNIDANPLFIDGCHLGAGSPCIDAADNTAVPDGITTDLDSNPRFANDLGTPDTGNGECPIVDMGAYEFPSSCPWDVDCDGNVGITDFLALLAAWGTDPGGPPDFDGGGVGITDFLELLANWGPCV